MRAGWEWGQEVLWAALGCLLSLFVPFSHLYPSPRDLCYEHTAAGPGSIERKSSVCALPQCGQGSVSIHIAVYMSSCYVLVSVRGTVSNEPQSSTSHSVWSEKREECSIATQSHVKSCMVGWRPEDTSSGSDSLVLNNSQWGTFHSISQPTVDLIVDWSDAWPLQGASFRLTFQTALEGCHGQPFTAPLPAGRLSLLLLSVFMTP